MRKQRKGLSWDLRTFVVLSIVIAVPANALLLFLPSDYAIDNYVDSTFVELLFFATLLLLVVIPRVQDRYFKTTAILFAFGFLFQLVASGIWYYYGYVAEPRGIPQVNPGDLFHQGSYVFWMIATVSYLRRYRRLMGGRSLTTLMLYTALGATIALINLNYFFSQSSIPGNDLAATVTQLSYVLIPTICLIVPLSTGLIYLFDGYGLGLKKYYWMYSIIPVCLIASSDLLRGTFFAIYESNVPLRFDDLLALTGYATAISAALRLLKSQAGSVASVPIVLEGEATQVRIGLKSGKGYIVEDPKSEIGFEMFRQLITAACTGQKQKGFIISRLDTIEIFQKYGLKNMRFTQVGMEVKGKPMNRITLTPLAHSIREYLSETKNGVVLIDGIDILIAEMGFKKVNLLLEQISDFASQHNSYVVAPLDPKSVSEKEMSRIERTFETIRVGKTAALG